MHNVQQNLECGALIEHFPQISVEPDTDSDVLYVSKINSYSKHNIFHKYCTNISTERTKKIKGLKYRQQGVEYVVNH